MISKIRHFASIFLCALLLAMSISCASTDPEEAEDAALSEDRPAQQDGNGDATAVSAATADAAAEADFAAEGSQPTAESPAPSDDLAVPPIADPAAEGTESANAAAAQDPTQTADENASPAATSPETADPFSGQESLSAATETTPEEQMAQEATEQVAGDAPAEPAVIEPAPTLETSPAPGSETNPPSTASASDPFARFNDSATEPAAAAAGGTGASDALPADPFAPAAALAEPDTSTGRSQQQKSAAASKTGTAPTTFTQTSELEYLVAPGDTLSEIAAKIYGSQREWQTIAQVNSLRAPFIIFPGDVLKIQTFGAASSYAEAYQNVPEKLITVQKGETLSSISKRLLGNGSSWKYIWKINETDIPNPNVLKPGQVIRFKDFRNVQVSL